LSVSQRILQKNALFLIYDENFYLLRSGDKKAAPSEGAAGRDVRKNANEVQKWILYSVFMH
jgi:hypothetical protein